MGPAYHGAMPPATATPPPLEDEHDRLGVSGHATAIGLFTAVSLAWFLPLPLYWFTRLPGYGDIWLTTWNFWWVQKAVMELGVSPWFCDWVFWPLGVDLSLHALSPLNSFAAIGLQRLGGLPFAYNTLFLGAFALSGYAAFLITHELTADRAAAYFAGYAFAFSPYHFSHLHHLEHLSIQWPAFLLWALLGARRARRSQGRSRPWMLVAAGFFVVTTYVNPYLGLFSAILLLVTVAADLLSHRSRAVAIAGDWAVFGALAGAFLAPLGLVMARAATSSGQFQVPLWIKVYQSLDLLALVTPSPNNPWLREWFPLMPLYGTFTAGEPIGYLGFSVLALAFWGWRRSWCVERSYLALGAVVFVILALGPVLHLAGIVRLPDGTPIPLPQGLLQVLPVISAARVPARYLALATLFVALLSGLGLAALRRRRSRPGLLTGLLFLLLVLEYWNAPFAATEPRTHPYASVLAADPDDVAVLDLPLRIDTDSREWWRSVDPGDQGWRQHLHGKRVMTGSVSHTALNAAHFRFFLESPLLRPLVSPDGHDQPVDTALARAEISRLRLRYLVLNREIYGRMRPEDLERDRRYIREALAGIQVHGDDEAEIWRVGEGNGSEK